MTRYVALLRAVNVGGTGKLPMSELRGLCEAAGFGNARTYIASGNVVFDAEADEPSRRSRSGFASAWRPKVVRRAHVARR